MLPLRHWLDGNSHFPGFLQAGLGTHNCVRQCALIIVRGIVRLQLQGSMVSCFLEHDWPSTMPVYVRALGLNDPLRERALTYVLLTWHIFCLIPFNSHLEISLLSQFVNLISGIGQIMVGAAVVGL